MKLARVRVRAQDLQSLASRHDNLLLLGAREVAMYRLRDAGGLLQRQCVQMHRDRRSTTADAPPFSNTCASKKSAFFRSCSNYAVKFFLLSCGVLVLVDRTEHVWLLSVANRLRSTDGGPPSTVSVEHLSKVSA